MKRILVLCAALATLSVMGFAKTTTIRGRVNDAKCGAGMVNAACAQKCVAAGEPAILVQDKTNKIYKIANQDAIKDHVGGHVALTGTVDGDTITITSVKVLSPEKASAGGTK